jgi:hypothetical protein
LNGIKELSADWLLARFGRELKENSKMGSYLFIDIAKGSRQKDDIKYETTGKEFRGVSRGECRIRFNTGNDAETT